MCCKKMSIFTALLLAALIPTVWSLALCRFSCLVKAGRRFHVAAPGDSVDLVHMNKNYTACNMPEPRTTTMTLESGFRLLDPPKTGYSGLFSEEFVGKNDVYAVEPCGATLRVVWRGRAYRLSDDGERIDMEYVIGPRAWDKYEYIECFYDDAVKEWNEYIAEKEHSADKALAMRCAAYARNGVSLLRDQAQECEELLMSLTSRAVGGTWKLYPLIGAVSLYMMLRGEVQGIIV